MPKLKLALFLFSIIGVISMGIFAAGLTKVFTSADTGAPPYGEAEETAPASGELDWLKGWKRPEGPPKVAIQVGHWHNDQMPEELSALIGNTGASGGGKSEAEVNLKIAEVTAGYLREQGVEVEVLPAKVPPNYWADVFIAIHADGSHDRSKSGFKIAGPWRDYTGKSSKLTGLLESEYQAATGFGKDPNVTRNMRGYYAFAWWRYEHAIHPMTTAVIVETGFLSSPADRKIIVDQPEISAGAIARGTLEFLEGEGLLERL